jgi:hypothetical protein
MESNLNILREKILNIKNQLDINIEYNRTRESRLEVEKKISKWESLLDTINELNFSSIESTINIEISQLDKDIFSINSRLNQYNNDNIKLALEEAEKLSNGNKSPERVVDDNVSKLNKTRELMKRAGLI